MSLKPLYTKAPDDIEAAQYWTNTEAIPSLLGLPRYNSKDNSHINPGLAFATQWKQQDTHSDAFESEAAPGLWFAYEL